MAKSGGSVALGRTPPWAISGLLYSLANHPFDAPGHPITSPQVIDCTQITAEPPAVMDSATNASARADHIRAKRRLRKLPAAQMPEPRPVPSIAEMICKLPSVENCIALLREDTPGHRIGPCGSLSHCLCS